MVLGLAVSCLRRLLVPWVVGGARRVPLVVVPVVLVVSSCPGPGARRCRCRRRPPSLGARRPVFVVALALVVVLALRVYVVVVPCSSSPASFHPSSTPRAVAHGAGGGWCAGVGVGARVVVVSSWWGPGARSSSSSVPAVIHSLPNLQAGACSGGSGRGVSSASFASSSPVVRSSCCFELHPFPPREQLLAAVVLGADLVVVPASP